MKRMEERSQLEEENLMSGSNEMHLFLEAVRESNHGQDVDELKTQIEVFQSQMMRLNRKYNESLLQNRKLEEVISRLNQEKATMKKNQIESTYQRKQSENHLKLIREEVKSLKAELKSKGSLIMTMEKERRKLNVELQHQERTIIQAEDVKRARSVSAERMSTQRKVLGRNLLKSGQALAYTVSKEHHDKGVHSSPDVMEPEMEKVILLQKLLLAKTKDVADRDVRIEQLENENREMNLMISRLKRTRHLANELTETRHKLSLTTHLLEGIKKELIKCKREQNESRMEVVRLRAKLSEFYVDANHLY